MNVITTTTTTQKENEEEQARKKVIEDEMKLNLIFFIPESLFFFSLLRTVKNTLGITNVIITQPISIF